MFWWGGIDVTIRDRSKNHIDMEIKVKTIGGGGSLVCMVNLVLS